MRELAVTVRIDMPSLGVARLWHGQDEPVEVSTDQIRSLIETAEIDYYVSLPADAEERAALLRADGERLYRFLDTPERRLSRVIERTSGEWDRLVLLLTPEQGLRHLPWELLHDEKGYVVAAPRPILPVRQVPGNALPRPTQSRPLRLMFMACAPLDAGEPLDYDTEQAEIWAATRRQSIELRVEESGDLAELKDRLRVYPEGHYDVVHLTGHAVKAADGARFLTEGPRGEPVPADAGDIQDAIDNRAALIFLSGCHTAEANDAGAVRSLAEYLAENSAPTVLGWGRAVSDTAATAAAAVLYRGLAQGLSPAHALAETYRTLIKRGVPDWHLLRMFVRGEPPAPLVTPAGAQRRDTLRRLARPGRGRAGAPDPRRFVGRRREVQRVLRLLDPREGTDGVGLIIYGMGGMGKTTLARRACERLSEGYRPVWLRGYLDEQALLAAISADGDLADILSEIKADRPLRQRLASFLDRAPELLFVLDEFEVNFQPDRQSPGQLVLADGAPLTQPAAAETLTALAAAIGESGRAQLHRVLVTSRYLPALGCVREFERMELHELPDRDVDRLVDRLQHSDAHDDAPGEELSPARVRRIREHAGNNPRLLEWLFDAARSRVDLDEDLLEQRLRAQRVDFLETNVFAAMLLDTQDAASRALLRAAAPFRLAVPAAVLAELCGTPEAQAEAIARRLARLGLTQTVRGERGPDRFQVPLVLAQPLLDPEPEAARDLHAACAHALARQLGDFLDEADPRRVDRAVLREVHRLALKGQARSLAVDAAVTLADIEQAHLRFAEAAAICEAMLNQVSEHRLHHRLALARAELGQAADAEVFFDRALAACPPDAPRERAAILASIGFEANGRNPGYQGEQLQEAIELARAHGRAVTLALALRTLARVRDEQEGVAGHASAVDLLAEAVEVAAEIDDGGLELANAWYDRALVLYLGRGLLAQARTELAKVVEVYQRLRLDLHQAVALLEMAVAWNSHGVHDEAERLIQEAARLNRTLRSARVQAFLEQMAGDIAMDTGQLAVAVDSYELGLDLAREIGNPRFQADCLERLGRAYRRLGQVSKASEAFRAAEDLHAELGSPQRRLDVLLAAIDEDGAAGDTDAASIVARSREAATLAAALRLDDREARALTTLTDVAEREPGLLADELEPRLRRLVELRRALDEPAQLSMALFRLGRMLVRQERFGEALPPLREALTIDEAAGATHDQAVLHGLLASVARGLATPSLVAAHLAAAVRLWLGLNELPSAVSALRELAAAQRDDAPALAGRLLADARALARRVPSGLLESQVLGDLAELADLTGDQEAGASLRAATVDATLRGHPLRVHVGLDVVHCFDPDMGAVALAEIAKARADLVASDGWTMPPVNIVDDTEAPRRGYVVYVWGQAVLRATLPTDRAILSAEEPRGAVTTVEPGFAEPVHWIDGGPGLWRRTKPGWTPLAPGSVVAANIKHLVRRYRERLDAGEPTPKPLPADAERTPERVAADLAELAAPVSGAA